jgi:hypothetical protein
MLASIDEADETRSGLIQNNFELKPGQVVSRNNFEMKTGQVLGRSNFELKPGQVLGRNNFELKSGQVLGRNNFELKSGQMLAQNNYSPPQDVDLLTPSISMYQPQIIRATLKRDAIMQV